MSAGLGTLGLVALAGLAALSPGPVAVEVDLADPGESADLASRHRLLLAGSAALLTARTHTSAASSAHLLDPYRREALEVLGYVVTK